MMRLSVVICTHNPRPHYLSMVLDALQRQTLSRDRWELLLIDNKSRDQLAKSWDLAWHPHGRHLREENLGLTAARLRGIDEAQGESLVFVDDDNVLAPDYLERSLEIADRWPVLGAWGGNLVGRFETPPPEWLSPFMRMLAIHHVERDVWSNLVKTMDACPAGAGLVVRSLVAREYARMVAQDEFRKGLDRKGVDLMSCGDLDLAYTACDLGLGTGLFKCLSLEHLIPSERLQKEYLLRLMKAQAYSRAILNSFRGITMRANNRTGRFRALKRFLKKQLCLWHLNERIVHDFADARERGREAARKELLSRDHNRSRGGPHQGVQAF